MTLATGALSRLANGGPCYIIAEAGSNHDMNLEQAYELIAAASDAGADAVKFQLFHADTMYPPNCGVVATPAGEVDFFELLRSMEMPYDWLPALATRSASVKIDLLFSAFDDETVDAVVSAGAPALKVASPELPHLPLLRRVARSGLPVLLSTGMSDLGDIEEAVRTLVGAGAAQLALLHCVTAYPCPPQDCNLDVIAALAAAFGLPTGYSDHTLDPVAAPVVAVATGACVLEKHFTLSRQLPGPDHPFSVEPDELRRMVEAVRAVQLVQPTERLTAAAELLGPETVRTLRGNSRKEIVPSEAALAACDRRSLHATRDIHVGDVLEDTAVAVLRGERNLVPGLHPRHHDVVVGAVAVRDVDAGQGIQWADLISRSL